jgi:hypothetical protein
MRRWNNHLSDGMDGCGARRGGQILVGYAREHGSMALQAAITSGQYSHGEGVFYGGRAETWSNRTLAELLRTHADHVRHVAFIDLHTGLGPYGVGEIINNHAAGESAFARVTQWFGDEATSTDAGSSSSAPVSGDITLGVQRALPQAEITGITLEYGTLPVRTLDADATTGCTPTVTCARARRATSRRRSGGPSIRKPRIGRAWCSNARSSCCGGRPPASPSPRNDGRLFRDAAGEEARHQARATGDPAHGARRFSIRAEAAAG